MDITNPAQAEQYLRLNPRASLIRLAAEGVECAATIAAVQGNPEQAANYRAAAARLRRSAP